MRGATGPRGFSSKSAKLNRLYGREGGASEEHVGGGGAVDAMADKKVLGKVKSSAKHQLTAPEPEEAEDDGAASLLD